MVRLEANGTQGASTLTIANGFTNAGTIELTCTTSAFNAALNVTAGTLVNAPGGKILALPGTGGSRTLGAELDNQGTVTADADLTLSRASANHKNTGTISIGL